MFIAGVAVIAIGLWLGSYTLEFARNLQRWAYERKYRSMRSEEERLEAVKAYVAWVRNMPPAPARPRRATGLPVVPTPVLPPVHGTVRPYPGRRLLGN